MRIAAILLIHDQPALAEQLVRGLLARDIRVVIHVDAGSGDNPYEALKAAIDQPGACFTKRIRCAWGDFSLVQATLESLSTIRAQQWNPDYVVLLSGADFPIKSARELHDYLSIRRGMEFIEAHSIDTRWVKGGPQEERFEYYYPFNWKTNRKAFDRLFALQRKLRRWIPLRKPPLGIVPYIAVVGAYMGYLSGNIGSVGR